MRQRAWQFCLFVVVSSTPALPQSAPDCDQPVPDNSIKSEDSVAAAALRGKSEKVAHSKKVFTEDDLQSSIGPFPRLKNNEAENGEDVVAAIATYAQSHSAKDTESAVHSWYDVYDRDLESAIKRGLEIRSVRTFNLRDMNELCETSEDWQRCAKRRVSEAHGAQFDQITLARNGEQIVRLQHSLMNIRNHLGTMGLRYDWFKVRTSNNIDRF